MLDKATQERLDFLNRNYTPLVTYHLNGDKKIYLGKKDDNHCRFCNKKSPDVTFRNIAHAIPEFTGNKTLICYYECDSCNSKFSRLLESHMANYMNMWHTFSQVRGKRGVPSFKTNQKKSRIDIGEMNVEVQEHQDDEIATIDEERKTITFTANRATYIPISIYKCLAKMALTIMPEDELENFKTTMAWINEEEHDKSPHDLKALKAMMSIAPGPQPYPFTSCLLFKRKPTTVDKVLYMIFVLAYGNFAFQIYLPLCTKDKELQGEDVKMVAIPTPIDMEKGSFYLGRKLLDLNSKLPVKGEKETIVMQYDKMVERDLTDE